MKRSDNLWVVSSLRASVYLRWATMNMCGNPNTTVTGKSSEG